MSSKWSSLFEICRPTTSLLAASAPLASIVATSGMGWTSHLLDAALAISVVFFFTMGSNALNDFYDLKGDKINHPERPLPSGRVSAKAVYNTSFALFVIALSLSALLSVLTSIFTLGLVFLATAIEFVYERKAKYNKGVGNFVIGAQSAMAFVFGGVVIQNIYIAGVMGIAAFVSVSGREIVKDIEDMAGDSDRRTIPMAWGRKKAADLAILLTIISIVIGFLPYYPLRIFGELYLIMVIIADFILVTSLRHVLTNPLKARIMMKGGMGIAIISFIIGGLIYV